VLQAPIFNGLSLDPFTLFEDYRGSSEVGIGGGHIVQALVVAPVIVMLDKRPDLAFEVTGQARGVDVTYETIRCWTIRFGPLIAKRLKKRRWAPSPRWQLDEVVCSIGGKRMYLWRAVDDEGEVLNVVVCRSASKECPCQRWTSN